MANRPRRRGSSGWIIGAIVILALLWVGYWYAAHQVAQAAIERVTSGPVAGRQIGCSGESLGGFPLRLDFRCRRATYAERGTSLTAELGGLSASAPLYWPGNIEATLDSPLVVNAPAQGIALTASWSSATATASAWTSGLTGGGAKFFGLGIENTDGTARLPITGLSADTAEAAVTPLGDGAYRLTAAAAGLDLTPESGDALPAIDGEVRLTALDVGNALGTDPLATFVSWLRAGGTANVERVRLAAAGAVIIADGTLTLSGDGLLSGSILLRFNSIDALADLIEAIRPGSRERAALPLQGLNAFSVPVETDEGAFRQTGLTFTDGVIWLGIIPLPIDPIPPLRF